ncbi:molybdate transport system ATP-binding protein [termite gut metagenome]|uniref:Molybdate transport system ATP-binding protein n=1 Tax=termite gut metagenome TaxID=433724 RepID=A0A5J4SBA2_9ZZZZ
MIYLNVEQMMLTSSGKRKLMLDIYLPEREVIALYGKSGAGKTTLLRIIAGLLKPDKGIIQIDNKVIFDSTRHINLSPQKRNIGFMFQDYALFPNMNVEQNICFAQKKDRTFVNQLIETFELETLRKQKPDRLSGGQRQRVALARSLARKPDILLLDEPLSSLDEDMRLFLQSEILKAHQIFHFTTLMVSHDKDEIKRISTQVLCISTEKINNLQSPSTL